MSTNINAAGTWVPRLREQVARVVVGQQYLVDRLLIGLLVLAIRHGETDWNVAARIQGLTYIPLNALGRQQAARLAQALADETLHAVYTSDLQRARDRARNQAGRHRRFAASSPTPRRRQGLADQNWKAGSRTRCGETRAL